MEEKFFSEKTLIILWDKIKQLYEKIYKVAYNSQNLRRVLLFLFDKFLLLIWTVLMAGITFFESMLKCSSIGDVVVYFTGLGLIVYSLTIFFKLIPLYKRRIICIAIFYFIVLQIYLIIDTSVIDSYTVFGFGVSLFCMLLILRRKKRLLIPVLCMTAQLLDNRFLLLYVPFIVFIFILQNLKEKITKKSHYMIPLVYIGIGLAAGSLIRNFFFMENPFLHRDWFLPDADYINYSSFALLLIIYICFYMHKRILTVFDKKNSQIILFLLYSFITVESVVYLVSSNLSYFYIIMVGMICFLLILDGFSIVRHIDFIKNKLDKKKFAIVVFFLFIVRLITIFLLTETNQDSFTDAMYYIDYQTFGFVQRGMVGSLCHLILGYDMPFSELVKLATGMYFFSAVLVILILVKVLSRVTANPDRQLTVIFAFMYFLSPAFFSYFHQGTMLRFDLYNFAISLLCIWLLIKNKYVCFIPLLCAVSVCIHQVFVFIAFPIIVVILLYRAFIDQGGHGFRNKMVLILSVLTVGACFIYFQFLAQSNAIITADEANLVLKIRSRGYFKGKEEILSGVILADVGTHLSTFQNRIEIMQIIKTLIYLVYFSPLIFTYFYAFFASARQEENKIKKWIYRIMPYSIVCFLPCYILETDYGRWNTHLLMHFILCIFFLTVLQREKETKWYKGVQESRLFTWCIIITLILTKIPVFSFWI